MIKARNLVFLSTLCVSSAALADGNDLRPHGPVKGHPNFIQAETDLHASARDITKSQQANECIFGDEGGHGQKAKQAILDAEKEVWDAAEWVNTHGKVCETPWPKPAPDNLPGTLTGHPDMKYHPNMLQAEKDLVIAYDAIVRSQQANECVFGVEGGHGQRAKVAILNASKQLTSAADWVSTHDSVCRKKG